MGHGDLGRRVVGRRFGKRSRRRSLHSGARMLTTFYPRAHACLPSLCCQCASHCAAILLPLEIYRQCYEEQSIAAQCTFFL